MQILQSRDTKANIAHYKNAQGTYKLPGQNIAHNVNIPQLMGNEASMKLSDDPTS
jgi:hypothetical protein